MERQRRDESSVRLECIADTTMVKIKARVIIDNLQSKFPIPMFHFLVGFTYVLYVLIRSTQSSSGNLFSSNYSDRVVLL